MKKVSYIIFVFICAFIIVSCQEIHYGMTADELLVARGWGKPKETIKIRDTEYEIWLYVSGYIDNLVFIKEGKVIERRKYSPSDDMWETVKEWVLYAEREPVYRHSIDKHADNIINQQLQIGMVPVEVRLAWGVPKEIRTYRSKYGRREEWFYERISYERTRLVFTNGVLTEIVAE